MTEGPAGPGGRCRGAGSGPRVWGSRLRLGLALLAVVTGPACGRIITGGVQRERTAPRVRRLGVFDDGPLMGSEKELGYYYVELLVGTPPQRFTVIVDTGSGITAFPCSGCTTCGKHMDPYYRLSESSTSEKVPCSSDHSCSFCTSQHQCGYKQRYLEGSELRGVYMKDVAWFGGEPGDREHAESEGVPFVFGCHTTERGLFPAQRADGIMGLSQHAPTLVSTLHKAGKLDDDVFALCLRPEGGRFAVGGVRADLHRAAMRWVPLATKGRAAYFKVDLTDITVGGASIGASSGYGAILDSGTTFTYVPSAVMKALRSAVTAYCTGRGSCQHPKSVRRETCWETERGLASDLAMPAIELVVSGLALRFLPEQYLYRYEKGVVCLGLMDNGPSSTVIGSNLMIGFDVAFDAGRQRVGFAPSLCSLNAGVWNGTANTTANASTIVCGVDPTTGALVSCGTARTMDKGHGGSRDKGGAATPSEDDVMGVPVAFVIGAAAVAAALAVGVACWASVAARGRVGRSRGRGRYTRTPQQERGVAMVAVPGGADSAGEGASVAPEGAAGAVHEVGTGGWGAVGEEEREEEEQEPEAASPRPGTPPRSEAGDDAPSQAVRTATPPPEEEGGGGE